MSCYYDKQIIKELEDETTKFIHIDRVLKEFGFPKDITKIIWEFAEPCEECRVCCELCNYYCYERCLRYNEIRNIKRDVCCKYEFNTELMRYKPTCKKTD